MMTEMTSERLRAHRNNIHRYRRLLATRLSDLERAYIERRLTEERARVQALLQHAPPGRPSAPSGEAADRGQSTLEMQALLHPADAFVHPMDVVVDYDLTTYEKRAILSSWAADACAVRDASELNRSSDQAAVSFDDILDALRVLDSGREASIGSPEGRGNAPHRKNDNACPRWGC